MKYDESFYQQLLDSLTVGIYFIDPERRITYWNVGAEKITGYQAAEVVGSFCRDEILAHVDECGKCLCAQNTCPAAQVLNTGKQTEGLIYFKHKSGHRVPTNVRILPIYHNNEIVGAAELFSEVMSQDEITRMLYELESLAMIDHLTGVGNRRYGEKILESSLNEVKRYGNSHGLLFIDIDNFKSVNDKYDHQAGDAVLKMVAKTIAMRTRSFDNVIRWGGEEFLVVLMNIDGNKLAAVAENIRALVQESRYHLNDQLLSVTVSIGASLYKSDDTVESAIIRADKAMYESKQAGKNKVTFR